MEAPLEVKSCGLTEESKQRKWNSWSKDWIAKISSFVAYSR